MKNLLLSFLLFLFISNFIYGQYSEFDGTNSPRSVSTIGLGLQNFASPEIEGAFNFNPAKLVHTPKAALSFFRQPFNVAGVKVPVESFAASYKVNENFSMGAEFFSIDYLDYYKENYLSLGAAYRINDEFTAGALFRYAWSKAEVELTSVENPYGDGKLDERYAGMFSLSLGILYAPACLDKKVTVGFSLMDLSDVVTTEVSGQEFKSNPPTTINLGVYSEPFNLEFAEFGLQAGFSKSLLSMEIIEDPSYGVYYKSEPKNSFHSLFNDWDSFPEDAVSSLGIRYGFKPIDLGQGIEFESKYYLGYQNRGHYLFSPRNYFTHGMEIGLNFRGLKFTTGFASIWYDSVFPYPMDMFGNYPNETFFFKLSTENDLFNGKIFSGKPSPKNNDVVISGGIGYGVNFGDRSVPLMHYRINTIIENDLVYELALLLKVNEQLAFEPQIQYAEYKYTLEFLDRELDLTDVNEFTFNLAARYYPVRGKDWYLKGAVGIARINPIVNSRPKYNYKPVFNLGTGYDLNVSKCIVLTPEVNYRLRLDYYGSSSPRIGGFNRFDFMIKAGYRF